MWKKIVLGVIGVIVTLVVGGCVALQVMSDPRPSGSSGADADELARSVQQAAGIDGWQQTGALRFQLSDRSPEHLWDRERGLVRAKKGDREVFLRTADQSGVVLVNGERKDDPDAVKSAWSRFINDSFWIYPFRTFFDDGVSRSVVDTEEDGRGLLIEYGSGGVTPGDAYLWILDANNRPTAWRMWVSVIPLGGMRAGWSDWQKQPNGLWISYVKSGAGLEMKHKAEVAATLAELVPGDDPFAPLFAAAPAEPAAAPASQPAAVAPQPAPEANAEGT